jgi:predicted small integral membrane protein
MLITRYAKILMAACLAAFCLLVAFDNITDYGTHYLFVQHVMSMDTTYPGNALQYRSVTTPALWTVAYWLIIAAEAASGICFSPAPSASFRCATRRARSSMRPRAS